MKIGKRGLGFTLALLASALAAPAATAAVFQVTRADDPTPSACVPGDCSLREALLAAAATPEADRIELGPFVHLVSLGSLPVTGGIELVGQGRESTWIVADGDERLFDAGTASTLHLRNLTVSGPAAGTIRYRTLTTVRLDHVELPAGSGPIEPINTSTNATVRIADSTLDGLLECSRFTGLCKIERSQLSLLMVGGTTALELDEVVVGGAEPVPHPAAVLVYGHGPVTIRDSLFRNMEAYTLTFARDGHNLPASPVLIRRTRFVGNYLPILGDRIGEIVFEDCEFSDNRAHDQILAPAVLVAEPGPTWRFERCTFARNLGRANRGGAILIEPGGRVEIVNSTFSDNSFAPGVSGLGRAIAVRAVSGQPTPRLRIDHGTLANFQLVPIGLLGLLLHVEGSGAVVQMYNSILKGTCSFANGGGLFDARGNIESVGASCGLSALHNQVNVSFVDLDLAPLADNGGFAPSHLPGSGSAAIAQALAQYCASEDQRGWLRPSANACDIGSLQRNGANDRIFTNGFQP